MKQTIAVVHPLAARRPSWFSRSSLIASLWVVAVLALLAMAAAGSAGWDAQIYWKALQSVHRGGDPYAEGIAAQQAFHDLPAASRQGSPPFSYVYSPMTLPLLRLLGGFPGWAIGLLYGAAIALGAGLQVWTGFQMADEDERRWLVLLLPAAVFFPGMVTDDVILSGNVAYILYGVVLAAAVAGWKRDRWLWYYIAVLAASIFKAPLLTLLAFPILVGRRQWLPAGFTGAAGLLLFGAQMRLWPNLFREYLSAVFLQFEWNHDFGFSPAGVLGKALFSRGLSTSPATTIVYLVFAGVLGIVLLVFSSRMRQSNLLRERWIPVALVGTLLLSPRIMKYDLAAFTVPMLLIGWRSVRGAVDSMKRRKQRTSSGTLVDRFLPVPILVGAGCFLIPNVITVTGPSWFPGELAVLVAIFTAGAWSLLKLSHFPSTCVVDTKTYSYRCEAKCK